MQTSTEKKSESPSKATLWTLGVIVFISGFCSLAYQVVWLREFRLLFGGATPAASAVLAVFMGGLGLGGAWLGAKVERSRYPGRFYALVEAGITLAALLSPLLFILIQALYIRSGGIQSLGLTFATLVQILMTAVIIGPACFLMGGTLPSVLKYAQSDQDPRRSTTALFYGLNVCGAVTGAFLATFVMLQVVGNRTTLFTAAFANAIIALVAWMMLRESRSVSLANPQPTPSSTPAGIAPPWFIYAAAFTSGFVFFLIELVWYRASIPLFGGSVYNFGLILAVALAGMGIGSLAYSLFLKRCGPSIGAFAAVSGLLALFIITPFVLGDYLAHLALLLNNFFRPRSFEGLVFGWSIICGILVFLPAFFAGIQFPLMISLLGEGNSGIGTQVGRTYAWNTLGAVSGALLGGFILIPSLSILGSWRLAAGGAILLSIGALALRFASEAGNRSGRWPSAITSTACCVLVLFAVFSASGPSAYWLHHPIGYGRAKDLFGQSHIDWVDYVRGVNRSMVATRDGRETSVALVSNDEFAIFTNGKSDSSAIEDAPTTVGLGLVCAALHPGKPSRACVVGLATGVTVGWLAQVNEVESVDVLELERSTIDFSRAFNAVNFNAMANPKTRFVEGDAREFFISHTNKSYDLIISEPSNLHRAGVANLFTREFYESVAQCMAPGAVFGQWLQAYETDLGSVYLVIATLRSVFPKVEVWQTLGDDLLLICTQENEPWDLDLIASRLQQEPFKLAMRNLWGTTSVEGFIARSLGNTDFTTGVASGALAFNTDDMNFLEFAYGRRVGLSPLQIIPEITRAASERGECIPGLRSGTTRFDVETWASEFLWKSIAYRRTPILPNPPGSLEKWPDHIIAQFEFLDTRTRMTPAEEIQKWPPSAALETSRIFYLNLLATANHEAFDNEIDSVREHWPVEAVIFEGIRAEKDSRPSDALGHYFNAIEMAQTNPWVRQGMPTKAINRANILLQSPPDQVKDQLVEFFEIASKPLAFAALSDSQRQLLHTLSKHLPHEYQVRAAESWGPHFPWNEELLLFRVKAFRDAGHPELQRAETELRRFLRQSGRRIGDVVEDGVDETADSGAS
jgi:spermidine synthase